MLDTTRFFIRGANVDDIPELDSLINSAYRGDSGRRGWTTESDLLSGQRTDPEMLRDLLGVSHILVAVNKEKQNIVGCVNLKSTGTKAYLGLLTVDVDQQRSGLGSYLVKEAETFARARFKAQCLMMNVISSRIELIEWYERRGYKKTGKEEKFPYGNERFGLPLKANLKFLVLEKLL